MSAHSELLSPSGRRLLDRRRFLADSASALGSISLASLLGGDGLLAASQVRIDPARPYAPRPPHHPPRAKNVLVIFCAGAVSQLETWDYKPELIRRDGTPLAGGPAVTFQGPAGNLARPQYDFRPRGQTGKMVSDLIPHLAELTDDIAFIHSLTSKTNTHGPAENFLSTGFVQDGFPSMGGWVSYALGSESQDLPAFVSILDPRGVPQASANNWGPGFLPAEFQGTPMSATRPIRHLVPPSGVTDSADRATRSILQKMNAAHLERNPGDASLAARIASYELAARMQLSVPEISDLSTEPAHVLRSYGADDTTNPTKAAFAKNCILARRLIERGVRFVQLFNGAYASAGELNWDGHSKLKEQYDRHAAILDQPAAALIRDLRQRGLLEETLVVWCTEFGRMPFFQKGALGRDHNPDGFTCWMTGAGVKPGVSHGVTDDLGQKAIQDIHPLYDFNATILHLLGLDHEKLTFYHNGLQRRLTNVEGHVIRQVLA
jgi:uncharacterized protein (DUF1501 family)